MRKDMEGKDEPGAAGADSPGGEGQERKATVEEETERSRGEEPEDPLGSKVCTMGPSRTMSSQKALLLDAIDSMNTRITHIICHLFHVDQK
jgi:hypothetical protein